MLAGSGLGYAAGAHLAGVRPRTSGDVEASVAATLVAGYAGAAVVHALGADEERLFTAAAMADSVTGWAWAERTLAGRHLSGGQARMMALGSSGGLLLGLATGLLVTDEPRVQTLLSAGGAAVGFLALERATGPGEDDALLDRVRGRRAGSDTVMENAAAAGWPRRSVRLAPAAILVCGGSRRVEAVPGVRLTWVIR